MTLTAAGGKLAVYRWGEGERRVLLLHGWSGRGPQMGAFVAPLLEAGYQVVAFDAPGHGRSAGNSSSIFRMNEALQVVTQELGPFHAAIAHSFGVMLLAYALKHTGFSIKKAVCISSPTTPLFLVDQYFRYLRIRPAVRPHFMALFEEEFFANAWQRITADENVRALTIPALILHDREDQDVPVEYGERLAKAWPAAQLVITTGLGHRRILRNPAILEQVTDFIQR